MYEKIVKQQRKEIAKLTLEQQKQILNLYDDAIEELSKKAAKSKDKSLQRRWQLDYIKELERARNELEKKIERQIANSTKKAAKIGTKAEQQVMKEAFKKAGIDIGPHFTEMFSQVQDNVVRDIITGNLYKDNKTLSQRIWRMGNEFEKDIQYTINQAILQKKSAIELAEDLEQFVKEPAKREADWGKCYPRLRNRKVDYNAMTLARTSINHSYQTASIQSSNINPFVEGIEWHSAMIHGRTCELCRERHGQVFDKKDVPLDHPNGLCTMLPVIEKSLDEIADELRNWLDGGYNSMLDEWYDEYGMYFIGEYITKKGKVNYAELGRKLAFERQQKDIKNMDFGLYIDNNKRELERIKRISKFEGVNQEKCKRIQRDIEKATEKLKNHDKYIFDRFSKLRYRTVEYKGFNEMVKTKIYFYDLDTYEERLDGMYYINFKSSVNKKEKEEILRFIDKVIMKNKRAAGVKIDIDNTEIKKRSACYYSPSEDKIVIGTMDLLNEGWKGGRVIGHELGHRPHTMEDTHYEHLAISKEDKKEWERLTEKYYQKYRVNKEPLNWDRFEYPINAEDYYKDNDKRRFYKEMWAEVTSVVTSPDDVWHNREKEIEKLEKYFPDLKEFMKKIYDL